MTSLTTFGLVLAKLVTTDLWLLPTIGKIIVFIILGILLLVLSFLYQKLKIVLFNEGKELTPPANEQIEAESSCIIQEEKGEQSE
jgi:hypothetical protein